MIIVNTRHRDFIERVKTSKDENLWVDYYYKLAVKELAAELAQDPELSQIFEQILDLQFKLELTPPTLILKKRGRPRKIGRSSQGVSS